MAAMSSDAWLSVLVKRGCSVVKPRTVLSCLWTDSFSCILEKCSLGEELVEKVVISTNDKFVDPCHIVPLSAPVSVCDRFQCNFVCFYLMMEAEGERAGNVARNASTILMSSGHHERLFPPNGMSIKFQHCSSSIVYLYF